MKFYHEQKYTHVQKLRVTYFNDDGSVDDSWEDAHKGLNKGHALYLASLNWVGAKIEAV
jgi:hypothetical protein